MNYYNIGYYGWSDCENTILTHNEKFTKDKFNEIIINAYSIANKAQKTSFNKLISEDSNGNVYTEDYNLKYKPCVSSLYRDVLNILIINYGFSTPEIHLGFTVDADAYNYDEQSDETKSLFERFEIDNLNDRIDEIVK